MNKIILIVEDEQNLMKVLEDTLLTEDFTILKAYDGEKALDMFYEHNPDLVLLDINLPKKDGWSVCKEIKAESNKPIIIMTARDTDMDELKGLSIGADDYITKPFNLKILILRIKKILKIQIDDIYTFLDFKFNFKNYELTIMDGHVDLTKKEGSLLEYMIKNKNQILTRDVLLNEIWGFDFDGDYRVVDTLVKRLRKKMDTYNYLIQTSRGMGYIFNENED